MSYSELLGLVDEDQRAKEIWETAKEVRAYSHYRGMLGIGISAGVDTLPFDRAMIFSWIKEELDNG